MRMRRVGRERDRDVARDGRRVARPVAADAQAALGRAVEREAARAVDAVLIVPETATGDGPAPRARRSPNRPTFPCGVRDRGTGGVERLRLEAAGRRCGPGGRQSWPDTADARRRYAAPASAGPVAGRGRRRSTASGLVSSTAQRWSRQPRRCGTDRRPRRIARQVQRDACSATDPVPRDLEHAPSSTTI